MTARAGSGWQTALADLSLILFIVMAAAVGEAPREAPPGSQLPALAEPVAVWRAGPGAPPLARWLAASGGDPLLRLTIVAPAGQAAAAQALAREAGRPARIVLETEGEGTALATLTYDRAPALAQGLQSEADNQSPLEAR